MKQIIQWFVLFLLLVNLNAKSPSLLSSKPNTEETFRAMFNSFTYIGDLKNAYKTGEIALKAYPNSLFWHEKLAQVAVWIGKNKEAMKHYDYLYQKTKTKETKEKFIKMAKALQQYEVILPILIEDAKSMPNQTNLTNLIVAYSIIGEPEKVALMLETLVREQKIDSHWLAKALEIYQVVGDNQSIDRVVKEIKNNASIDIQTAKLLMEYHFSKGDIRTGYQKLLQVTSLPKEYNLTEYYQKRSDIGWHLQDFDRVAMDAKTLYERKEARAIDYERIVFYYGDKDPDLVEKVAHEGYERFQKEYFLDLYLQSLLRRHRFDALESAIKHYSQGHRLKITEDIYYWIMRATFYQASGDYENALEMYQQALRIKPHSKELENAILWYWLSRATSYQKAGEYKKALEMYQQALRIEPDSIKIELSLLWFYIDVGDTQKLKEITVSFETTPYKIPELFWLPLASAHMKLQQSDRAMVYLSKIEAKKGKREIELEPLYGSIMLARAEENGYMSSLQKTYDNLQERKKNNPSLLKNKIFVENYLKTAIEFMPADIFQKELDHLSPVLGKHLFAEISVLFALRHEAYEDASKQMRHLNKVEPWMTLAVALANDDRTTQQEMIYKHASILPIRDRVLAATNIGDIALAHSLAYEGIEENERDYFLYKQRKDLIQITQAVDTLESELRRSTMSDLIQNRLTLKTDSYLAKGIDALIGLEAWRYEKNGDFGWQRLPVGDLHLFVGAKKVFERSEFSGKLNYYNAIRDYFGFDMEAISSPLSRLRLVASYEHNAKSSESNFLWLGGKKDRFEILATLQYLPSSSISISTHLDRFKSQDNLPIANAKGVKIDWYQVLRSGYPDIAWGGFYDITVYSDFHNPHGAIDTLSAFPIATLLPQTYEIVGTNFFYGIANKTGYERVWRPYAQCTPYYNISSGSLNVSFDIGYGGHLYLQDHLTAGINYDQIVDGSKDNRFDFYLHYKMFY